MILLFVVRSLHIGSAMLLFGMLFFAQITVKSSDGADAEIFGVFRRRLTRWFFAILFIQWISGLAWLLAATGRMTQADPWYVISLADLQTVLGQTQFGRLWLIRSGMALALTVAAVVFHAWPRLTTYWAGLLLSLLLLISLAWAGHAGAGLAFRSWRLTADAVHLFTGAVWPMGLIPLALFLATPACRESSGAWRVVGRFSRFSLIAVCVLILTGSVASWFLVGSWTNLFTTLYGRLLLIKLLLFAGMIGLGYRNRALLGAPGNAPQIQPIAARLRRNVLIESLLALLVLGIVGILGATPPPH